MLVEKNLLSLLYLGSKHQRVANSGSSRHPLTQERYCNLREKSGGHKTKDLIAKLLAHGEQAARGSRERAHVAISVFTPEGRKAVRIKMRRADIA